MDIIWRPKALDDLESVRQYIAERNPAAARGVFETILSAVATLSDRPEIGRPGRVAGTRELVLARIPYIVAYTVLDQGVTILAVMHGAREWPDEF
jgi:addiction module RelE/StbE family toxin